MTRNLCLTSIIITLALMGCSSISVTVNYDETINFNEYKTFSFERPRQQQVSGQGATIPILTKEIMLEIQPIIESKGLIKAASKKNADLLVIFYAAVKNRRDVVRPTNRGGRRGGRAGRTRPGRGVRYIEDDLVIDLVDQKREKLVWKGINKGALDRTDPQKNLKESAAKILENFPPNQ